jgi:hypothetical protein
MAICPPATPESNTIVRPSCSKCGAQTLLARIDPDLPGHDRRTFECPHCGYSESVITKIK